MSDYRYINHFGEFKTTLKNNNIDISDVCIVGSANLSARGIRVNRDLDFVAIDKAKSKLESYDLPSDISLQRDRYSNIGISDRELITNSSYYDTISGIKVVRPEISLSYKKYRQDIKDQSDVRLLVLYSRYCDTWSWDKVVLVENSQGGKSTDIKDLVILGISSLFENGLSTTAFRASEVILPDRYFNRVYNWNIYLKSKYSEVIQLAPYSAPELMFKQYDDDRFVSYDILLSLNYEKEITSDVPEKYCSDNSVLVDREFKILNPDTFVQLASKDRTKIPVRMLSNMEKKPKDKKWIENQNLGDNMSKELTDLLANYGVTAHYILWPTIDAMFDEIEETIQDNFPNSQSTQYSVDNMDAFIEELYDRHGTSSFFIEYKKNNISNYNSKIRHIMVDPKQYLSPEKYFNDVVDIKDQIRERYAQSLDLPIYAIIHSTDSFKENLDVVNTFNSNRFKLR